MRRLWSRYHPRSVRSLVYMLQASEYRARDYLAWLGRVQDFARVEKRKRLEWTLKARVLYTLAWIFVIACAVLGFWFFGYLGLLFALLAPLALPYAMLLLIAAVTTLQWPLVRHKIQRVKKKLAVHPGVKIAIAGSFGKTTMREILKTVLSAGKKVAAPPGSYNTPLGVATFVEGLTGDEEILIFEFGEYYPGDVRALCNIVQPSIGIITGVNEAHLERFGSLDRTAATIFELKDFLAGKTLYVNGESQRARDQSAEGDIIYDNDGAGVVRVVDAKTGLDGTDIVLDIHGTRIGAHSALLGLHHIGPIAAAADIAYFLGFTPAIIAQGIENTKPFEHRLEPKESAGVITLDDSYNGNPDGVRAVIEFLASLTDHRRFYVTPGLVEMGVRTEAVHRAIGVQLAEAGIEKVILIKNSVTPYIEAGLKNAGYEGEVLWFDDGPSAFCALPHLTLPGDVVLLQNDWPDQYA